MTHRLRSILLVAALVAGATVPAPAAPPEGPTVRDLKERALLAVKGDAEPVERGKAVAALAAVDDSESARALAECLQELAARTALIEKERADSLRLYNERYAGFTLDREKGSDPWETKRRLLDLLEKQDERLQSDGFLAQVFLASIAKMRSPDALGVLERAASASQAPHARRALWGGLLQSPSTKAADVAKKALRDEDPTVRLAALESMALRQDPGFVEPGIAALRESGWPLRRAAIHLLGAQNDVRAVPPLVAAMAAEDGALLEDYSETLAKLTGVSLGHHAEPWRKWAEEHKAELAEKGAKAAAPKGPVKPQRSPLHYYGVETLSKKVVFVLDVSGSMKEPIGVETTPQTGVAREQQDYTGPKIEVAKRVLAEAIRKLPKDTTFNIVIFNHQVRAHSETMLVANDLEKDRAYTAIEELQPLGSTYTYGALRKTLEIAQSTCTPEKWDPCVDTVFVLSDGAPTDEGIDDAKPMEGKLIVDAVAEWNAKLRVKIHTIAIDPRIGKGTFVRFMKELAARNGGTYTEIGAK